MNSRRHCPGARSRSRQWGLAVVESAVILPLVLFMMLAVAEIGRAVGQYNTLTKAVRDGVRAVTDNPTDLVGKPQLSAAQVTRARNMVVFGNPAGTGPTVLPGLATNQVAVTVDAAAPYYIRVTANYTFVPVLAPLPTFGLGNGNGITLGPYQATAVMRNLRQ